MIDEKIKEIHSIKNEINKLNNIINNNIIFSPLNQKIKYKIFNFMIYNFLTKINVYIKFQ